MSHAFWGPEYPDHHLRSAAETSGYAVQQCADNADLVKTAGELIANGKVMGWIIRRRKAGRKGISRNTLVRPIASHL